jgi:hypothetical protein
MFLNLLHKIGKEGEALPLHENSETLKKEIEGLGMVLQVCHSSNLVGSDEEYHGSRSSQLKFNEALFQKTSGEWWKMPVIQLWWRCC